MDRLFYIIYHFLFAIRCPGIAGSYAVKLYRKLQCRLIFSFDRGTYIIIITDKVCFFYDSVARRCKNILAIR